MNRRCFGVLTIAACMGLASLHGAETDATPPNLGSAFAYKQVGERSLPLYFLKPEGWQADDRRPAIVFFHGGGWKGGGPHQFEHQALHFARRGAVCFHVVYRFVPTKNNVPPSNCVADAKSAMRWVRKHAPEFGVDPMRIAAAGGSAGGHLAAATGMLPGLDDPQDDLTVSPRPDALILFNPVIDNSKEGYGNERIGDRVQEFSPAHNVTRLAPPTLLLVGSEDRLISPPLVRRFEAAMQAAGVRCDVTIYEGQPHGFFNYKGDKNEYYAKTLAAADAFLTSLGWLSPDSTTGKLRPK